MEMGLLALNSDRYLESLNTNCDINIDPRENPREELAAEVYMRSVTPSRAMTPSPAIIAATIEAIE
jgi:hypothetical protein